MIPILFDENAKTYTTNGVGALSDVISWQVSEELNGIFELEMEYPIAGAHFDQIKTSAIIYAEPYAGGTPQPFRVYRIGKALDGHAPIYARHVSYQLNWLVVMPFTASTLADCLTKLKTYSATENPFTFWTNKTINTGIAWTIPQSLRSMLGGTEGSILQTYGGDYEWDAWTVKLWNRRGADNGVRIAYGKNLVSASMEENIGNTYTGVCPYWSDEETGTVVTLPEKYILASTAADFPFERIKTVDFSTDFDDEPSVATLRNRTQQYITANNIGHPNINIEVNMAALWQTEEYKGVAPLESVALGDTVTVDIPMLNISTQARVVGYVYDGVKGRYKKLSIGDAKSSFAKTFVDQGRAIEASLGDAKAYTGKAVAAAKSYSSSYTDSEVDRAIAEAEATAQELMENATNWLTSSGGYVVAVKNTDGSWKELLFLDSPSTTTASKVLRINNNGMGFSRDGVGGPYRQAWTLDGKLVVGGTDAVTISGVDASNHEIFGVNKSGISWLLQSSIMTKNGTLYFLGSGATATSGNVLRLNSSGISFGKNGYNGAFSQAWDMNGKLMVGGTNAVVISASNGQKEIFNVNQNGISWNMAQSIMNKNGTLYFLESGATATSGKVMRLSNAGISFSKNGYNGTYTQAWNIGGQLTVGGSESVTIRATNSAGKEIFGVNQNGISWTMAQSIMNKNGTLYFLGSGATATSGNVMRLNNLGISFSKNGYNGTYTQSWTINGNMTLGGVGNKYGAITIQDSSGNPGVELDNGGVTLYKYTSGTESHYISMDGSNIYATDERTDEDTSISPANISMTDADGNGAEYSGSGFQVAQTSAFLEDGLGVLSADVVRGELQPTAISVEDDDNPGSRLYGITDTLTLPGGWDLKVVNGVIVEVSGNQEPGVPDNGYEGFFIDGQHVYFHRGIMTEFDEA